MSAFARPDHGIMIADQPIVTALWRDRLDLALECGERAAWYIDGQMPPVWWRYVRWADLSRRRRRSQ